MTKDEIKARLTELDIEFDPKATVAELKALLPVDPADPDGGSDEGEDEDDEVEPKGDSVTVTWRGKSRVFSKAVHGKDLHKLAKQFASKFDGTLV